MYLNRIEERLLKGEEGIVLQKCMELLVKYGDAMNAKRLLKVDNAACVPPLDNKEFLALGADKEEFLNTKVRTVTAALQGPITPEGCKDMGVKDESKFNLYQKRQEVCQRMGIYCLNTCVPYLTGYVPVRNQIVAWTESSTTGVVNGVFGARTNLEGTSSFCAAITGRMPEFGFYLDENRLGTHLIKVEAKLRDYVDFDLLGYFVGKRVMLDVPVFVGMPQPDLDKLKAFSASSSSSGGVQMYHIVGLTPEAPTVEVAFGGDKPREKITVGWDDLEESYDYLNSTSEEKIDYAVLGCPHSSMTQIREIASLLEGKKVKVPLWIATAPLTKHWAEAMGYAATITKSGAKLIESGCPVGQRPEGAEIMATNSCKMAHYAPGFFGLDTPNYGVRLGKTMEVVEAAISGKWKGKWRPGE
jgi:predicted aconitase